LSFSHSPASTATSTLSLHDALPILPAGPSEVLVIADHTANPAYIAADLLAQAEHGGDSQAVLVCTDQRLIDKVQAALDEQLPLLDRKSTRLNSSHVKSAYAVFCLKK